jgi:hypothetical protein
MRKQTHLNGQPVDTFTYSPRAAANHLTEMLRKKGHQIPSGAILRTCIETATNRYFYWPPTGIGDSKGDTNHEA